MRATCPDSCDTTSIMVLRDRRAVQVELDAGLHHDGARRGVLPASAKLHCTPPPPWRPPPPPPPPSQKRGEAFFSAPVQPPQPRTAPEGRGGGGTVQLSR